jgi:uncharacterized pyridoxal phosphate-dependent enzyme
MAFGNKWNRRSFLGTLGIMVGSAFSGRSLLASPRPGGNSNGARMTGFGQSGNVYEELGVTTVINGQGTMTYLGGSLIPPEVEAVMAEAGRHFVNIVELEEAAGKKIAEMLKLPAGYSAIVTSGAAGAMQSGLAGILTADNPQLIQQLPDLTGMKSEVIIQKTHRNAFDHQLRATGIKLIEIETTEELGRVVSGRTAMMHFSNFANGAGQIKVDEWVKLAAEYKIPTFIDAAADTPPVSHLWDYANMGYDLIAFSGGKALRGPQCAGLLIGKKDLVHYALLNNSPHEDTLGRGQKIGKEEIVGMVKALEIYLNQDHEAITREWWNRLDEISRQITRVAGISTAYFVPEVANHVPHMQINWDPRRISLTPEQAANSLQQSKPSIILASSEIGLSMNSFMLQPGENRIIADRLVQLFRTHSV